MSNMDGFTCKNKKDVTVLRSDDGYYTGTMEDIGPFCRVSKQYHNHEDGDQKALDNDAYIERDCKENRLCAGGCSGCHVRKQRVI